MSRQKIIRTGNSLAITLPAKLVRTLGLKPGSAVTVSVSLDQTEIRYKFVETGQLTLVIPPSQTRIKP